MNVRAETPEHAVELLDCAFNAGDLEAVLAFYEDNATVVPSPNTILRGGAQLRAFFESALRSGSHAQQLKMRVFETDGIALFLSRWTLGPTNTTPGTCEQIFVATTVFRKQADGSWKILIDNPFGPAVLGAP